MITVLPDDSDFDIDRYTTVRDNVWAKLHFNWWKAILPACPVAPDEMSVSRNPDCRVFLR